MSKIDIRQINLNGNNCKIEIENLNDLIREYESYVPFNGKYNTALLVDLNLQNINLNCKINSFTYNLFVTYPKEEFEMCITRSLKESSSNNDDEYSVYNDIGKLNEDVKKFYESNSIRQLGIKKENLKTMSQIYENIDDDIAGVYVIELDITDLVLENLRQSKEKFQFIIWANGAHNLNDFNCLQKKTLTNKVAFYSFRGKYLCDKSKDYNYLLDGVYFSNVGYLLYDVINWKHFFLYQYKTKRGVNPLSLNINIDFSNLSNCNLLVHTNHVLHKHIEENNANENVEKTYFFSYSDDYNQTHYYIHLNNEQIELLKEVLNNNNISVYQNIYYNNDDNSFIIEYNNVYTLYINNRKLIYTQINNQYFLKEEYIDKDKFIYIRNESGLLTNILHYWIIDNDVYNETINEQIEFSYDNQNRLNYIVIVNEKKKIKLQRTNQIICGISLTSLSGEIIYNDIKIEYGSCINVKDLVNDYEVNLTKNDSEMTYDFVCGTKKYGCYKKTNNNIQITDSNGKITVIDVDNDLNIKKVSTNDYEVYYSKYIDKDGYSLPIVKKVKKMNNLLEENCYARLQPSPLTLAKHEIIKEVTGNANDEFVLIAKGKGSYVVHQAFYVEVTFINDIFTDKHVFPFDKNATEECYIIEFIKAKIKFDRIKVNLCAIGDKSFEAEIISFDYSSNNNFYTLNEQNIISNIEKNCLDYKIEYHNGIVKRLKSFSGFDYTYSLDSYKSNDYIDNLTNGLYDTTINNRYNPSILKRISKNGIVESSEIEYYDDSDLIKKEINGGNIIEYKYNENDEIIEIIVNNKQKQTIIYDLNGRLTNISYYKFIDDEGIFKHVSNLNYDYNMKTTTINNLLNNNETIVYCYDNYHRIKNIKRNNIIEVQYAYFDNSSNERNHNDYNINVNGKMYSIYHDNTGKVFMILESTTAKKILLEYEKELLIKEKFYINDVLSDEITYYYDEFNNLTSKQYNNQKINYYYNDANKLIQKNVDIDSTELIMQYNDHNANNSSSLKEYLKNFSYDTLNDFILPNKNYDTFFDAQPIYNNMKLEYDEELEFNVYVIDNNKSKLTYCFNDKNNLKKQINVNREEKKYRNNQYGKKEFYNEFLYQNCIGCWFKTENKYNVKSPLFSVEYSEKFKYILYVDEQCNLTLKCIGDKVQEYSTNLIIQNGRWNYVEMYYNEGKIFVRLNYQYYYFEFEKIYEYFENYDLKPSIYFHIGNYLDMNVNIDEIRKTKIAYITIGSKPIMKELSRSLYDQGRNLFNLGAKKSTTSTLIYNPIIYKDFNLIPLNGSFSSKMNLLEYTDALNNTFTDKNKMFVFDEDIKRLVYNSSVDLSLFEDKQSSNLKFQLDLAEKGFISMWVKIDPIKKHSVGYIISNINEQTNKVIWAAFVDQNCEIRLVNNLDVYKTTDGIPTGKYILPNEWTFVCFRWNLSRLDVKVNDELFCYNNCSINGLSDCVTYIGNTLVMTAGKYLPGRQFEGNIELVAYKDDTIIETSVPCANDLYYYGRPITYNEMYDDVDRLKEKSIITSSRELKHYYRYYDLNKTINRYPHLEVNCLDLVTKYLYNDNGLITSKIVTTTSNEIIYKWDYDYDSYGSLIKETYQSNIDSSASYTKEYEFDLNRNIVGVKEVNLSDNTTLEKHLTYDEDLIKSVNCNTSLQTFEYNNKKQLIKITKNNKGINLLWTNSMLKQYGSTTFEYDQCGRRICKCTNDIITYYFYDDEKIICSEKNQIKTFYLYDSNNYLFGFQINNIEYYYVRDITGIINEIVDCNGNIVVEYTYDGYGKILQTTGNQDVLDSNIFVYKGYCYDAETNLFLVTSRYYSPELGRFIQPEDVSSLNPSSINGLNLYSYANNNPIGIAYSSSNVCFGTGGGMVNSLSLGGSLGGGTIGRNSSSWFTTLPAVPNALKHISKANDVFSAVSHSFMIGKYLFGNGKLHTLSYLDDMRMLGVNPAKGLSSLPNASWLNKLGYVFSAIDGVVTIYDNLQQGNSWGQALLDGALSFGKSAASAWVGGFVGANVGGMIGAALGSIIPIPGVGTFIGFVVGTGVGIVVSWFVDDVLGLLKDGLLDLIFD